VTEQDVIHTGAQMCVPICIYLHELMILL